MICSEFCCRRIFRNGRFSGYIAVRRGPSVCCRSICRNLHLHMCWRCLTIALHVSAYARAHKLENRLDLQILQERHNSLRLVERIRSCRTTEKHVNFGQRAEFILCSCQPVGGNASRVTLLYQRGKRISQHIQRACRCRHRIAVEVNQKPRIVA